MQKNLAPVALPLAGFTVAFDLDGTLVDTAPDLVGTLNDILVEEGLAPLPYADVRLMVGQGVKALLERGFAASNAPLDADRAAGLFARFISLYAARIARDSRPFPGAVEMLETLRAQGARLCVCTNKLTGLSLTLLDALDLTRHFDAVVGQDHAPAPKPDPRHLIAAVQAAGGVIERAVLIGDSHADVGAAKAAGAPSVVVSFGYIAGDPKDLGGDHLIDRFDELPALVAALAD